MIQADNTGEAEEEKVEKKHETTINTQVKKGHKTEKKQESEKTTENRAKNTTVSTVNKDTDNNETDNSRQRKSTRRSRLVKRPSDEELWSLVEKRKQKKRQAARMKDVSESKGMDECEQVNIDNFKMLRMDYIKMFLALMALLSLNVNGLRNIDKMNSVFTTIKHKHANITFLQETFWDNDFIERYKRLWEGKIYYNNCPNKNRRGVAILLSQECPYKFTFNSCHTEGRILKINTHIDNEGYSFINVYAPNNVQERIQFCNKLKCYIDSKNTFRG